MKKPLGFLTCSRPLFGLGGGGACRFDRQFSQLRAGIGRLRLPVARLAFPIPSQGADLDMAYMDVKPATPNGETAVLFHGKNFCAATWEATIKALNDAGYRVIAPDQIGFCKSSKPEHYQYSFQQLAGNTRALLASLGVARAMIVGHSTGGMLAFATD